MNHNHQLRMFLLELKTNPDIKTTPIPILRKKYSLSYKKLHPVNTDILIKSEDLKKVYQPFTYLHSDTL